MVIVYIVGIGLLAVSLGTNCSTDQGSVTEPTAQKFKQWLGTDSICVPHYGIKVLIDPGPAIADQHQLNSTEYEYGNTAEVFCRVYVTAYIECKGVR